MDGDEQVRLRLVGDVRTVVQGDVAVVGTREDHLDVRIFRPDLVREGFGDVKGQRLLVRFLVLAHRAGILPAVAGVDHDRGQTESVPGCGRQAKKHGKEQADCAFQKIVVFL